MMQENRQGRDALTIPIWEKATLTVDEACAYTGIGEKAMRGRLREPGCPFALSVGSRTLVKRKELERYIAKRDEF